MRIFSASRVYCPGSPHRGRPQTFESAHPPSAASGEASSLTRKKEASPILMNRSRYTRISPFVIGFRNTLRRQELALQSMNHQMRGRLNFPPALLLLVDHQERTIQWV